MKRFVRTVSLLFVLFMPLMLTACFSAVKESEPPVDVRATDRNITSDSCRETLPVQYEVWHDKKLGEMYTNYVYTDFIFDHGYTGTESWEKVDLSLLEREFFEKAYLVTVRYDFY